MARILVIDDSEADRLIVAEILSADPEVTCEGVEDGEVAFDRVESDPPDLVLTDLIMPGMNGFAVVRGMRADYPSVPVVLMTSQGNERIAVQALKAGAASYVPKLRLANDLLRTVREVLGLFRRTRAEERVLEALDRCELSFSIESHDEFVLPLVRHLQEIMSRMGFGDEVEVMQIGVALAEALGNAIEHGNLEVAGELRETDGETHRALVRERRSTPPWCDRCVHIEAHLTREEARFTVRDKGRGFDPVTLPDPREPANLDRAHGRGVMLMRSFMDDVTWNETGNEVTMVKRCTLDAP